MSINHKCKKCNQNYILTNENYSNERIYFRRYIESEYIKASTQDPNSDYFEGFSSLQVARLGTYSNLEYFICPDDKCNYIEVVFHPLSYGYKNRTPVSIQPGNLDLKLPSELKNKLIINDLGEAFSIHQLSPRASIVLSRRALHSMIREVFNITKNNDLIIDITNLKNINDINRVGPNDIDTLHKIRKIGNDGAHGPLDVSSQAIVSSDDAKLVIDFILSFMQKWYVYPEKERVRLQNLAALHAKVN